MKTLLLLSVVAFIVVLVFFAWVSYEEYMYTKRQKEEIQARNRRLFRNITFEEQHDL